MPDNDGYPTLPVGDPREWPELGWEYALTNFDPLDREEWEGVCFAVLRLLGQWL
jgi:hypothetical protein